jgi:hypothetical protein
LDSVVQVGVEILHGHSGVVEVSEWDRGKINGVERELPQKHLVMVERCREGAARGIVERATFWKGKRAALACCERVCLV